MNRVFKNDGPRREPNKPQAAVSEYRTMGWGHRGVQREHAILSGIIWTKWVPVFEPEIDPGDALSLWHHFMDDPARAEKPILVMKMLTARLFAGYCDLN